MLANSGLAMAHGIAAALGATQPGETGPPAAEIAEDEPVIDEPKVECVGRAMWYAPHTAEMIRHVEGKTSLDADEPFVDYYYDDEAVQWYRKGYDGVDFFVDPVARPGLNRPVIRPQPD